VSNKAKIDRLMQLIARLQEEINNRFLSMGELLHEVYVMGDWAPYESFREVCESKGIGYRKALYLIDVYRTVHEKRLDHNRVLNIGWTKMKTILPKLSNGRSSYWLKQAETTTVVNLEARLAGKSKADKTVSAFKLDKADMAELNFALQLEGAIAGPGGLHNKEKALMKIVGWFLASRKKKAA
jgi:hypothetical protein